VQSGFHDLCGSFLSYCLSFGFELLCVFGFQALPAIELHDGGSDHAAEGIAGEEMVEDVEADVPAGGAPGDEAVIDVVPELQTSSGVPEGLEFPAEVPAAPVVFDELVRLGALHGGFGDLWGWSSDG
jgi:hypothetical protein